MARNEAWRFSSKLWGTNADRTFGIFIPFKYGFAAFVVVAILFETVWKDKDAHHHESPYTKNGMSHGHGDAHEHYHVHNNKYKLLYELKGEQKHH